MGTLMLGQFVIGFTVGLFGAKTKMSFAKQVLAIIGFSLINLALHRGLA